jgi:hypothetical protein
MTPPLPRNRSLIVWRKSYMNSGVRKYLRTICDVIRELHRSAEDRGDLIAMHLLDQANDMANRMQDRLKWYSLKRGRNDVTLTVDDVGVMYWLLKKEYKRGEGRRVKSGKRKNK